MALHYVRRRNVFETMMDGEEMLEMNESTSILPNASEIPAITDSPPHELPCQYMLYKEINGSRVRIWDLIILIPNVLFLLFLLYKSRKAVLKLRRTNSPIFLAFYGLVSLVAIISVLRCIVSMTVNATVQAGDIADQALWLLLRFFLLATELSVVIFGLAFGHLDSHTSIRRVLILTFLIAFTYSTIQGVLEFQYPDDHFHVDHDDEEFDMFGHGGMLFWFASSVFFFVIYSVIVILPFTAFNEHFAMPTKKSFYAYCGVLAVLNLIQAVGSGMLYFGVDVGLCIVNVTTYLYFTCYAPLVYYTFLRDFFRTAQPQNILFSYKTQYDEGDDDQLHLPSQTYTTPKHLQYATGSTGSEDDPALSQSIDSTHFVGSGPNPLYDADLPFTGDNSELAINTDYFSGRLGGPLSINHDGGAEMKSPVA